MKKKIIGFLVCTLLIGAGTVAVADWEEGEWENNVSPVGNQQYIFWRFHPRYCNGLLGVFATYNCMKIYPCLYHGYVEYCKTYNGSIPRTHEGWLYPETGPEYGVWPVNDIIFEFIWDWCCLNHDIWKIVVPYYSYPYWELENIVDWVHENVEDELNLVSIGDSTGEISDVYIAVDGNVILENPPIVQDEYYVEEGYCDELPGYLIGTTPIVFNPQAGPSEFPFETTPLTGVLNLDGTLDIMPEENRPPGVPEISGPRSVRAGTEYCWTFHSEDPDGDDIMYIIEWGDGDTTETDCYPSCEPVEVCHTYAEQGTYVIKAKAQECPDGLESDWSQFVVTVPRNKIATNSLFLRMLERFPNAFPILRLVLGLQ